MPLVPDEPCARKTLFIAHREAAEQLWGTKGLIALGEILPAEVRRATIEPLLLTESWIPERYLVAWHEAVWEGPCRRDSADFYRYLHAMLDCGFGRIQRLLLTVITPASLFTRGEALWRRDHSHGTLTCSLTGERSGLIHLRDHPYVTSAFSRRSVAETFRYVGSLSRCKAIRESHNLEPDGSLRVKIDWD
jgi:hypothetical protein